MSFQGATSVRFIYTYLGRTLTNPFWSGGGACDDGVSFVSETSFSSSWYEQDVQTAAAGVARKNPSLERVLEVTRIPWFNKRWSIGSWN